MPWIFNPLIGLLEPVPISVQALTRIVYQAAHGFTAPMPVQYNGSTWVKADSTVVANLAQGIVIKVTTDSFVLCEQGFVTCTAHGLTLNLTYYTTDTAGVLGTAHGTVTQAVLYTETANTLQVLPTARTAA